MYLNTRHFFEKLVLPTFQDEDKARSEFILNVLLASIISLSFIALILNLIWQIFFSVYGAVPRWVIFIVLSFFIFLYFLSRKGFSRFASYILLVSFFLPVTYQIYSWGIDLPAALLTYALIIVMASVLISTRFAFLTTMVVVVTISLIGYAEYAHLISIDRYWRGESWIFADLIFIFVIFLIIATVSWLSNREIKKSLMRARRSEAELKKERDSLEITVEQRTRKLKETQAEKMTQLYRFAEFGRLSSGLFHDLINPLTAVSLNIEKAKSVERNQEYVIKPANFIKNQIPIIADAPISEVSEYIDKAIVAAKNMENMVSAVRKQLSRQENKTLFSVNDEIAQALEVLAHKAQKSGVAIRLFSREEMKTYGDAVKFNQVVLNLIANAIDAYLEKTNIDSKPITMSLSKEEGTIVFEVKDKGVGIPEENKPKLFEPFFTTKKEGYGFGIGLSMTKRIIEKDFGGSINVESKEGAGSAFMVKFPQKDNA